MSWYKTMIGGDIVMWPDTGLWLVEWYYLTLAGGLELTIQDRLTPYPRPEWTTGSSARTSGLSANRNVFQLYVSNS